VLVVFTVEAECGEPSITTGNWGIALLFDDQQVSVTGYVTSCTCVELAFELGYVLVVFTIEAECGEPSITTGINRRNVFHFEN